MSDMVHLLEEYRASDDASKVTELEAEVRRVSEEKKRVEDRFSELDKQASEVAKNNGLYLKQVSELESTNKRLGTRLEEAQKRLSEMEKARDDALSERGKLEVDVKNLQRANGTLAKENEALKLEVQKNIEEIAKALGDGYDRCLKRVEAVGFDPSGHSFDEYIKYFSKSLVADGVAEDGGRDVGGDRDGGNA